MLEKIICTWDNGARAFVSPNQLPLTAIKDVFKDIIPKFDADRAAFLKKRALVKRGIHQTIGDIKQEWERARKRGIDVHNALCYFAALLREKPEIGANNDLLGQSTIDVKVRAGCELLQSYVDVGAVIVGTEITIGSERLGICGKADIILYYPTSRKLQIVDFKTTANFTTENVFQKLNLEFHNFDHSKINEYGLQSWALSHILGESGFNISAPTIVHLTDDGFAVEYTPSYVLGEQVRLYLESRLWQ